MVVALLSKKRKKIKAHAISVKKEGEVLEIRIYRCQQGREETFRGKARLNNPKEMATLFEAAQFKGLEIPKGKVKPGWWFDE